MQKLKDWFNDIDWKEVSPGTWARYAIGILVALNSLLSMVGVNPIPFSEDKLYVIISGILTLVVLIVNTYKNNSTSTEAVTADKVLHLLKEGAITVGELMKDINAIEDGTYKKPEEVITTEETPKETTEEVVVTPTEEVENPLYNKDAKG